MVLQKHLSYCKTMCICIKENIINIDKQKEESNYLGSVDSR